jgi:hypothetical protein
MKSIIVAETPAKIPYMDNPPAEGGEIKYLTPDEYKQKFNCEYTEGIVVKQLKREPANENDFKDARGRAAYERLLHPLEHLVICKMSHDIGYGLFTTEDIPMGTVICLYTGEYDPKTAEFVYSYGSINAAKIGGVARFMQHQPISKENHEAYLMQGLKDYRLFAIQENIPEEQAKVMLNDSTFINKKVKEYRVKIEENDAFAGYDFEQYRFADKQLINQIAQSNVAIETTEVAGVEVILMVASRDIKKNESIGFSYGVIYWQHPSIRKSPLLFGKTGQIILPEKGYAYSNHEAVDEANAIIANSSFNSFSQSDDILRQLQSLLTMFKDKEALPSKFEHSKTDIGSRANLSAQKDNFELLEQKLQDKTLSFFKKPVNAQWKPYPEQRLAGKYIGHQVRFFTMAANETVQAKAFAEQLQRSGFDAELKRTKDKPSVIVDLTTSKLTLK